MRRVPLPPQDIYLQISGERFLVYSGAANPTVAEVPENQWIVYYNTTLSEFRLWTNIAGVLYSTEVTGAAPAAHAPSHQQGGSDAIKLDDLATPDDNTDLNASTTRHGLLKKLSNVATEFLNGQGNWATPPSGSGGDPSYTPGAFTVVTGTAKLMANRLELTTTLRATLEGTGRLVIH